MAYFPNFPQVVGSTTAFCPFHHCKHDAAESFPISSAFTKRSVYK